jgi:hypothetical protein
MISKYSELLIQEQMLFTSVDEALPPPEQLSNNAVQNARNK